MAIFLSLDYKRNLSLLSRFSEVDCREVTSDKSAMFFVLGTVNYVTGTRNVVIAEVIEHSNFAKLHGNLVISH